MAATDDAPAGTDVSGFATWLDARRPGGTHVVVGETRPRAGYSAATVLVDVDRADAVGTQRSRWVVKLPPPGPAIFPTCDFGMQARLQDAAAAAGIPAATPAWFEPDPSWLGAPFLAMSAVDGWIVGEVPALDPRLSSSDPAANAAIHDRYLDVVAAIGRLDWRAPGLDAMVPRRDNTAELDHWRAYLAWYADGDDLVPLLGDALDWCVAHRPATEPSPSLLWGDVRLENLILDDDGEIVAVLDWEMATIGAAEHDLAWLLVLQDTQDRLVGRTVPGFPSRDGCIARYEARLGRSVRDLAWYEVLAAVRSTAILTRIAVLNERRGAANFFPVGDNPVLDLLARRISPGRSGRAPSP